MFEGIEQSFELIVDRLALVLLLLPSGLVERLLQHVVTLEARGGPIGDEGGSSHRML